MASALRLRRWATVRQDLWSSRWLPCRKGRKKTIMRPLPWWVPMVSPDPSVSDAQLQVALEGAMAMMPAGCVSMFPPLVSGRGKPASLELAVGYGDVRERSTPARLLSAFVFLFMFAPLGYSRAEARRVAGKKHAPRHVLPELMRVRLMPEPARDEVGRWKGRLGRRITSQANRYSRKGERILQILLRAYVLRHVCTVQRAGPLVRLPLEAFAVAPGDLGSASMEWERIDKMCLDMQ